MDAPPDEITVETAAQLLGVSPRRYRQLAAEGYCTIHARGRTTITSAVSGFIRSLRATAETSPASAAAARQHGAKAALVRSHTARRRSALIARAEAEEAVSAIASAAVRRLRDARLPASIPTAAGVTFRAEVNAACARITEARDRALKALASGDLSLLDGARDG